MITRLKEKLLRDLKEVSHTMGIEEKELVDRAVLLYLESVKNLVGLNKEFRAWDELSDEAMDEMGTRLTSPL